MIRIVPIIIYKNEESQSALNICFASSARKPGTSLCPEADAEQDPSCNVWTSAIHLSPKEKKNQRRQLGRDKMEE
jgi:hypothetical protein